MRKRSFNQKFMAAVLAAALAFTSIEAMPAYAQSTEDAESIMEVSELTEATSEQNADIPALAEADDVPDTPDQAEELPMGQEIRRGIQPGATRDVDYFKFTTSDNPEIYYFLTVSNREPRPGFCKCRYTPGRQRSPGGEKGYEGMPPAET